MFHVPEIQYKIFARKLSVLRFVMVFLSSFKHGMFEGWHFSGVTTAYIRFISCWLVILPSTLYTWIKHEYLNWKVLMKAIARLSLMYGMCTYTKQQFCLVIFANFCEPHDELWNIVIIKLSYRLGRAARCRNFPLVLPSPVYVARDSSVDFATGCMIRG